MVLQNILWPETSICTEEELFFRTNRKTLRLDKRFLFSKGGQLFSDTYFNGVSVDKLHKYTIINDISVTLSLKGAFRINLIYKKKIHEQIFENIVTEIFFQEIDTKEITLLFPKGEGMASFSLHAIENDSEFLGGYYSTNINDALSKEVKIGIGICTFRRESFIENNIKNLNKSILENNSSELYGKLEVFISDNGKTLDINKLESEHIHIVKNKNTGGAGGFTRDLIEMMESNRKGNRITHALLMDDDITIAPESLLKTYRILCLLKEEYKDAFIGGAMLRNDAQYIQVESGASWNAGKLISLKCGLDMRLCDACLYNEVEEYREFNAWWYCCFPMSIVREDNLPLPIFIRGDDLEYGLRNMKKLILINGICVWHEPFENKYSSFLSYYILRNQLIDNALHCPEYGLKEINKQLFYSIAHELAYYRYKNIDLIIRGIMDFLKGVDFFLDTEGEKLHQEIMASGYKAKVLEDLDVQFSYPSYEASMHENDKGIKKIVRIITINGYILPTNRNAIVSMAKIRPINSYRAKKILNYDVSSGKGFVTERSGKEFAKSVRKTIKMYFFLIHKYNKAKLNYQKRSKEIQSIAFWQKYLEVDYEHGR